MNNLTVTNRGVTDKSRLIQTRALRNLQRGITLVELIVAMGLGILLTAGVGQIFIANRQTERLEQALNQVQDTGRYAMNIIATDVRQAGYYGCLTPQYSKSRAATADQLDENLKDMIKVIAKDSNIDSDKMFSDAMDGYTRKADGTFSPALPASLSNNISGIARNGSDIIRVYFGETIDGTLANDHTNPTADISININNGRCPSKDDLYLLASCNNATLFRVTNEPDCSSNPATLQHASTGNTSNSIPDTYLVENTFALRYVEVVYFVGDTGRSGTDGQPVYALYRRVNGQAPEELLEGVEFLKVEFGQLLQGGNIRYVTPDTAGLKSAEIISARVGVLVKNSNNVTGTADTQSYDLPGGAIAHTGAIKHGGGNALRKAFVSTIKIRNRS